MSVFDIGVIRNAELRRDPFEYFIGSNFVRPEAADDLRATFPDFHNAGFHPVPDEMMKGAFGEAIRELKSEEMSQALSEKFGIDFHAFPRFITVRKVSAAHEGRIHCNSESKIMSMLVYLNEGWSSPDGRLRVLRSQNSFDDYAAEVDPKVRRGFRVHAARSFLARPHAFCRGTPRHPGGVAKKPGRDRPQSQAAQDCGILEEHFRRRSSRTGDVNVRSFIWMNENFFQMNKRAEKNCFENRKKFLCRLLKSDVQIPIYGHRHQNCIQRKGAPRKPRACAAFDFRIGGRRPVKNLSKKFFESR